VRRVTISFPSLIAASLLLLACVPAARGASGAEVYKVKCALCHDGGATSAPRSGTPADWTRRSEKGYAGLLRSALQGVPGTAMLPKAGFPELTESEVAGAVRHMLALAGLPPDLPASAAPAAPASRPSSSFEARVDDARLALSVADALLLARVGGVQIEARDGRVVLKGVVDDAATAKRALQAASRVAGVRSIENRLVGADIFEHD
jgi:cytochrome c5